MPTLGHLLVNDILPEGHKSTSPLGKASLNKMLTALAKEDPGAYVGIVSRLKKLGDELSTTEGVSVGLDDIAPEYAARDKIMYPAIDKVKHAKNNDEREKIILGVQDQMMNYTRTHGGSMTQMALSGARGNIPQLMKTVGSPVAAVDHKGAITSWLVSRSYAEGLSPADYWVTGNEARINTIKSSTSVAEPGDLAKILVNNLYPYVITMDDCGTHNGVALAATDGHVMGRYLARDIGRHHRNELITPAVATDLIRSHETIYVRSPMTCEAHPGICRKCQGLDEKGKPHAIGINVGVRSAQALAEPLTQFALNAKHGVRVLKGASKELDGLAGVRQMIEVPQSFFNKATLAEHAGTVTKIFKAPHGGHYVHVGNHEHYVSPHLDVLVHVGQVVEAGDVLSDGVPKPDELVAHKGLGVGRQYLVDALHRLYKKQGVDLDKRHLEILARADLNHVKVLEHSDAHPELLRGDIVPYHVYKNAVSRDIVSISTANADGRVLGKETLHFTVGTPLTPSIVKTLQAHGVKQVDVATSAPRVEFIMKPMTRNPLLNPDWLARMSHRYLKDSLLRGAHTGDATDYHSTHPVPAYAYGAEFGGGTEGRY
jgi:DNA-directed RNA polymerase subunit beta'